MADLTVDPIWNRFQLELGVRFDINWNRIGFRKWLFDPYCGLTLIGERILPFSNGRSRVPEGTVRDALEQFDNGIDPKTGMKDWGWISRCFWIRGAIRVLGVDVGAGFYYRLPSPRLTNGADHG